MLLGSEVPEPPDMTEAGFDAELFLAPHEDHIPTREYEEEFPPEEAAPLQQERWESGGLTQQTWDAALHTSGCPLHPR